MAEAGVAPGAVIHDAEGENLGANQEILQQQAQEETIVDNIMNQVLIWIGFDVVANRQALRSEIAEIKDMVDLTEKDITELQESYAKRTQNAGQMYFGLQRTKQLKATLHWVQDFARVSKLPNTRGTDSRVIQSSYFYSSTESGYPEEGGERRQFRFH